MTAPIRWYIVRLKRCGCLVSSEEPNEHQARWIAAHSLADILRQQDWMPDGTYVIARRVEDAVKTPEFCATHKPKVSQPTAAKDDAQGSLFG